MKLIKIISVLFFLFLAGCNTMKWDITPDNINPYIKRITEYIDKLKEYKKQVEDIKKTWDKITR